jgi:hypothetical protein
VFTRDAGIVTALQKKNELEDKIQQMSSRYGSHHLKILALNKELEESNRKLELQIDASILNLENDIKSDKVIRKVDGDKLIRLRKTIRQLHNLQLRYVALQQTIASARRHQDRLIEKRRLIPSFSSAVIPMDPFKPRIKESLFWIFTLSLAVMSGLTLLRTRLGQ